MEKKISPKKIFISYSSRDKEFVTKLYGALSYPNEKEKILKSVDILLDDIYLRAGDEIKSETFTKEIDKADGFIVLVSNSSIKSGWVKKEYNHAMKIKNRNKDFLFIPILIEDIEEKNLAIEKLPFDLENYKYADFRSPFSFLKELDKLISKTLDDDIDDNVLHKLMYNLAIDPHLELMRFNKIIHHAVDDVFDKHISPMKSDINRMIKLTQANERIMTLEAIAEAEKNANDSIWVITTHLNNDVNDKEIRESVKENQDKGIEYTYFVPKESSLIKKRLKAYIDFFEIDNKAEQQYQFISMDENEAIMPFAEVVIYDPEDHMSLWGYVELNYNDRTTDKDSVFLRIPHRNLFPLVESLKRKIKKEKEGKE